MPALHDRELSWHFIGRLQANKTRADRRALRLGARASTACSIAERLSEQRPFHAPPLNVCLQVNLAGEASKGGVAPRGAAGALPRRRARCRGCKLRGLMCLPPPEDDPARQRHWFAELRRLQDAPQRAGRRARHAVDGHER